MSPTVTGSLSRVHIDIIGKNTSDTDSTSQTPGE